MCDTFYFAANYIDRNDESRINLNRSESFSSIISLQTRTQFAQALNNLHQSSTMDSTGYQQSHENVDRTQPYAVVNNELVYITIYPIIICQFCRIIINNNSIISIAVICSSISINRHRQWHRRKDRRIVIMVSLNSIIRTICSPNMVNDWPINYYSIQKERQAMR